MPHRIGVYVLSVPILIWSLSGLPPVDAIRDSYDQVRLSEFAILTIGLLFGALMPGAYLQLWLSLGIWERRLLCLMALAATVSCLGALAPLLAATEVTITAALVTMAALVRPTSASESNSHVRLLILAIGVGGGILTVRFITDVAASIISGPPRALSLHWDYFVNVRFYAKAATWVIPVLAALTLVLRDRRVQIAMHMLGAFASMELILSGSRGALLGLGCAAAMMAFLGPTGRRLTITLVMWSLSALLLLFLLHYAHLARFGETVNADVLRGSTSGRDVLYRESLKLWLGHPLFGIGPMQLAALDYKMRAAGPHNWPLQWLAEWGLIAAVCGFALAARLGVALFRNATQEQRPEHLALFGALMAAIIHSFVANVINDPLSQLLMALSVAALHPSLDERIEAPTSAPLRIAALVGFGAVATLFSITTYQGEVCWRERPALLKPTMADVVTPRLWMQGTFPFEQTCFAQ